MLHPYVLRYYENIKTLRKFCSNTADKVTVHATLLDFPGFIYESFDHFLHPETGAKFNIEELIENRITDSKSYAQIFHTSDFRVTLTNSSGHLLKVPKQWLMPTNAYDLDESEEELKDKYEAFYNGSKDIKQIDFENQAMLCKRHEKLLEETTAKKEKIRPFNLIHEIGLWVILLCHGGSFSIGIFNGMKLLAHKSDKKYLIRKKAGKRQANKDKSKSVMNSVGSQMRREMEKLHQENVANIMEIGRAHV